MAALTQDLDTQRRDGYTRSLPVAANAVLFAGAIACLNASDLLTPGVTGLNLRAVGRVNATTRGTAVAGEVYCEVDRGIFKFNNSSAADLIALRDVGLTCYIVDDNTVAKTTATNTRSIAGRIFDVDATGVWVEIGKIGTA